MTGMEDQVAPSADDGHGTATDVALVEEVSRHLDSAEADEASRLGTLEDIYRTLESELEGDLGQATPPRR